jgi:predicted histidine transporter YuiF (NhaC family)
MEAELIGIFITLIGILAALIKAYQKSNEFIQKKYDETINAVTASDKKNHEEMSLILGQVASLMRMMLSNFNECQLLQRNMRSDIERQKNGAQQNGQKE